MYKNNSVKLFIVVEQIKNFSEYCKYISNKFTLPYEKWVMCIIFLYCVSEKSVFRFFSHTIHRCIVLRSVLVGTESINWGGVSLMKHFFSKIPFLPTIYGLIFENVLGPIFEDINCFFTHKHSFIVLKSVNSRYNARKLGGSS